MSHASTPDQHHAGGHHHAHSVAEWKSHQTLGALAGKIWLPAIITGVAGLVVAMVAAAFTGGTRQFLFAYLTAFMYVLSFTLGSMLFVLVQHVTRAGWGVVIRRLQEIIASAVLPLSVLFLPILVSVLAGDASLYPWNDPKYVADHPLVQVKASYLNSGWFTVRAVLYFSIWILITRFLLKNSLRQDQTADPSITIKLEERGGPLIFLFALSSTFAAIDWMMSLSPEWYSTIFGVYYFAGAMVGSFALLNLLIILLQQPGGLLSPITTEHRHDTAKFLFGFTCFWAYIGFSQYMLIWYANIPEETLWFQPRQNGGWEYVSLVLIFGHFFIPFFLLLRRQFKRSKGQLAFVACWLLVMHYIDLYWLIYPQFSTTPVFGLVELGTWIGLVGLFFAALVKSAGQQSLLPLNDPRLDESLRFHNI
ncbi:MAG: quinol:cytochrome C oxidoreductase [Planctomyces sp.]|nr:quinol:cytochrome C oxidoreductase [Planctomyces sp.]